MNQMPNNTLINDVLVVMVPFPAQGHLNQLLHLSRLISSYDIPVHFLGYENHIRQAKHRVHGWNSITTSNYIHFHEFPAPKFHVSPNSKQMPTTTTAAAASAESRSEIVTNQIHASLGLYEPVSVILHELSRKARRLIVVHDALTASAVQDIRSISNTEAYVFHSTSSFTTFVHTAGKNLPQLVPTDSQLLKLDLSIPDNCFSPDFVSFIGKQIASCQNLLSGHIYDTCKDVEGEFFELVKLLFPEKFQWALGPLNPVVIPERNSSNVDRHKCLEWLDKQAPNSVILVSFGTSVSLSEEQIKELAIGLEQSQHKFIWVLRAADKDNESDSTSKDERRVYLPKGYEEMVKTRGIVVRDWAPQLEILGHLSIGGFLSHCGWNSCTESINMGVPIAAWPMHSDQPCNAFLITDVLKIGIKVGEFRQHDLVTSATIEKVVKTLMASEEGNEMRRRAAELANRVRQSVVDEEGLTRLELISFIAHITK
ncbi:PREDICTED: zeatin O-glucosyltransferase-like [Nicotiana attenuata]|uniref:Glycosyltransferase n=1 Tax=Nicotiana attenuata TaxID=49451 RepID=A0A2I2MNB9_NICAT|nr:PREDICTED: zeatin O-glucosyltransferase-like [Nicotiana attenuata]AQQ16626.1 UDP-glycosyltransferase g02083 [Nicotiana attenuata]OIT36506.1 zeatin o-glucosyltransferase [Nicotiana attenuata]